MMRSSAASTLSHPTTVLLVVVACGVASLAGFVATEVSVRTLLITATALVLLAPIGYRAVMGTFDVFEPIVLANVALGVMFVARPIAVLAYDEMLYQGRFDIEPTFDRALFVALLGIIAYTAGYVVGIGRSLGRRIAPVPGQLHSGTVWVAACGLIALAFAAYALYAAQVGFSPLRVLTGGGITGGGPNTTAYLYQAPFLIFPAALLLISAGLSTRRIAFVVVGILLAALLTNSLAPAGQRLSLLLLLGSFAVYPMLRTGWRPSIVLVLGMLVPAFFATVAMRDLGSGGGLETLIDSVETTVRDPGESWEKLMTEADTEMFSALALELQVVPEELPHDRGSSLTTLLAHPIPRILWPEKPRPADDLLNVHIDRNRRLGNAGIAFSVMGGLYYDSAYAGVLLGMFAVGIGLRTFYEYLRSHPDNDTAQMLYAAGLPLFTVVLMRGNFPYTFNLAPFTVAPIVLVALVASAERLGTEQRAQGVKAAHSAK